MKRANNLIGIFCGAPRRFSSLPYGSDSDSDSSEDEKPKKMTAKNLAAHTNPMSGGATPNVQQYIHANPETRTRINVSEL